MGFNPPLVDCAPLLPLLTLLEPVISKSEVLTEIRNQKLKTKLFRVSGFVFHPYFDFADSLLTFFIDEYQAS